MFKNNGCLKPRQKNLKIWNQYCPVTILILKKLFHVKLQQTDSPHFTVENFKTITKQLNKDNFSIMHLNIRMSSCKC